MTRPARATTVPGVIDIPRELAASQEKYNGEAGRAFIAGLPERTARFLDHWDLRPDGPPMHGVSALVVPVVRSADGTAAVLKLQILDEESAGEPAALRAWNGDGAVRLLDLDEPTGTMLLERLDETRMLSHLPDPHQAVVTIAELLAHLTSFPAPPGMRRLGDIAQGMLDRTPWALGRIPDPEARRVVADCAAAVREVVDDPGDRLLPWDLHDANDLAPPLAPWLAIPDDVRWRFDAMTEILALDHPRAHAWTLARLLQNALWDIEDARPLDDDQLEIARRLSTPGPRSPRPGH